MLIDFTADGIVVAIACAVANYYITTLAIWLGHFLPHRPASRLRSFHMDGHHRLYSDSAHVRSSRFRYGHGREDSLVPLAPWIVLVIVTQWAIFPLTAAFLYCTEVILIVIAASLSHAQFHLEKPLLRRYHWFRCAQSAHDLHHDADVNFMVVDHFWDRCFGTYQEISDGSGTPN